MVNSLTLWQLSFLSLTQVKYTDVVCINRYYAWYHDPGHLEIIQRQFETDLNNWYDAFKKPVLQTEYGADTIPGLHRVRAVIFSFTYLYHF